MNGNHLSSSFNLSEIEPSKCFQRKIWHKIEKHRVRLEDPADVGRTAQLCWLQALLANVNFLNGVWKLTRLDIVKRL